MEPRGSRSSSPSSSPSPLSNPSPSSSSACSSSRSRPRLGADTGEPGRSTGGSGWGPAQSRLTSRATSLGSAVGPMRARSRPCASPMVQLTSSMADPRAGSRPTKTVPRWWHHEVARSKATGSPSTAMSGSSARQDASVGAHTLVRCGPGIGWSVARRASTSRSTRPLTRSRSDSGWVSGSAPSRNSTTGRRRNGGRAWGPAGSTVASSAWGSVVRAPGSIRIVPWSTVTDRGPTAWSTPARTATAAAITRSAAGSGGRRPASTAAHSAWTTVLDPGPMASRGAATAVTSGGLAIRPSIRRRRLSSSRASSGGTTTSIGGSSWAIPAVSGSGSGAEVLVKPAPGCRSRGRLPTSMTGVSGSGAGGGRPSLSARTTSLRRFSCSLKETASARARASAWLSTGGRSQPSTSARVTVGPSASRSGRPPFHT